MKKVLFYAGLLALATGCAENEFDSLSTQKQTKGITFVNEEAGPSTRMQWDEVANKYAPFWYAEQDRIGIYGLAVIKDYSSGSSVAGDGFKDLANTMTSVTYKATQSKKNGAFTSVSDADMLRFDNAKDARFVAVYPSTVEAEYKSGTSKIALSNLPELATQTQTTNKGNNPNIVMYDLTIANKENAYDAVGEKVQLSFQRPLSAIVFKTKNANTYTAGGSSIFGNLNTINVTTKGYDKVATDGALNVSKGDILASTLTYDVSKATIEVDTLTKAATFQPGATPTEGSKVALTLNQEWSDDALAIAVVKNVDRKAFRDAKVKEAIDVVFSFANIDLTSKTTEVSVDFNGFLEFPALDINEYDYLVTKGETGNTRTLIVNKGNFGDIFSKGGNVKWADTESSDNVAPNEVLVTEFETIIVNEGVTLTDADFAKLNTFTGVKNLTLANNTEIKANALNSLAELKSINMPKVTKIGDKAFTTNATTKLETVLLPAYNFEDLTIYPQILNKTTLKVLDMSGVEVMNAGFPAKGMSLAGYGELTTVTVKDGVTVGANAFKECAKLVTINGKVNLIGTAAFKGCKKLAAINITNTLIPANAFEGNESLKSILKDGKQVVPTEVGAQAFSGCVVLEEMDLKATTKIGQQAFMDCIKFVGKKNAENNKNVLYVGAANIPAQAFAGCLELEFVYFINATGFGDAILGSTTTNDDTKNYKLKEVKFGTVFTKANVISATATTFGVDTKVALVKLFVNPDQDVSMLNDATLILKDATTSPAAPAIKITFASITKEAKY